MILFEDWQRLIMTRIQFIIIVLIAASIASIAIPRAILLSRINKAEHNALTIANGFKKYREDTGQDCRNIQDLIINPGVPGWSGPYIKEKVMRNPWNGTYEIDYKNKRIVIPNNDKAPDRFELGGSEEIGYSFDTPL
ncbi:MAG: type II secretion system protein GspG [bacterium]